MNLLSTGSVLAAFFAGTVALFAPCCIVFLAPSYLAAAVKNRRWRLLPLTFVFAAGLALVLVPITLGMSLIAATVAKYHAPFYYAGGALMLLLAAYSLSGRMWSLPSVLHAPDTARGDSASFFALGVFSGIASSCCAPVLAGVMTLSALSRSPIGGVALGLAYVLGMTFPLFVMALTFDRLRLGERRWAVARPVRLRLGRRTLHTNTVNLAVAVAFAVIGGFLGRVFTRVEQWTSPVPEPVLGLLVLAIAGVFVYAMLRDPRRRTAAHQPANPGPPSDPAGSCHHHSTTA